MHTRADALAYYATHGPITDPGVAADWLATLPGEVPLLGQMVRGLVLHYRSEAAVAAGLPADRLEEVRTRQVERILLHLAARDPRPLTAARPPQRRFVGCCRDFATLACAALRHRGVPARVRVGFATYHAPDFCVDHWVAEYWEADRRRWVLVDAESEGPVRVPDGPGFDPCDVPRDRFLVAGRVWLACRAGAAEPRRFGYDPESCGLGVVRSNLLHDLACLNKIELTPWDCWGLGLSEIEQQADDELALLDQVAVVTLAGDERFSELRAVHDGDARLRVPSVVTSYPLAGGRMEEAIGVPA